MEPTYPLYEAEYEDEDDLRDVYLQAATRLTCAAIQGQLIKAGSTAEETSEGVLHFFEAAFRRIREVAEEDPDYLDEVEEDGEDQTLS